MKNTLIGWVIEGIILPSYVGITLTETNISPENGWLEYDPFLLGPGLFSGGKLAVSFREGIINHCKDPFF